MSHIELHHSRVDVSETWRRVQSDVEELEGVARDGQKELHGPHAVEQVGLAFRVQQSKANV